MRALSSNSGMLRGMMPLAILSIALLVTIGLPTSEGLVPGDFRSGEEGIGSDEKYPELRQNPIMDDFGYSYIQEGYPMTQGNELNEAEGEDEREPRTKRERCYCDLDLFCKRFGCRRRKRVSAQRMRSEPKPTSQKTDLILRLVRRLSQNARRYRSQPE